MCNQTVSLISAEIERAGIPTVCLMLLRSVAEAVRPPRALAMPYPHGYPLGRPGDAVLQRTIVEAALQLIVEDPDVPVIRDFTPA